MWGMQVDLRVAGSVARDVGHKCCDYDHHQDRGGTADTTLMKIGRRVAGHSPSLAHNSVFGELLGDEGDEAKTPPIEKMLHK